MSIHPTAARTDTPLWADRLGVWASVLCAIHCLLTPVLLSFSSVAANLLPGEERTHRTLSVLVACLGLVALLKGYRRHGRRRVFALVAGGLALIFLAAWGGDRLPSHPWEVAVTCCGGALMIAAHRANHTFCRNCACASRAEG